MAEQTGATGRRWSLGIRKVGGRWMVEKPKAKPHRGLDLIEWTLYPDPAEPEKPISAHFQFAHRDLLENPSDRDVLTRDLTAVIPEPNGRLLLKVQEKACRRKNPRHYAVWIRDETLPNGGVYAVGEEGNPPPEMDVGP